MGAAILDSPRIREPLMHRLCLLAACAALAAVGSARAITIRIDYSYDTQNFFGAGNPDGPAAGATAKASIEAAAGYLSGILQDTLTSIDPPTLESATFNGVYTWHWNAYFLHPGTGGQVSVTDLPVAADEYVVFAGGRSLSGTNLGAGGFGESNWYRSNNDGFFTAAENNQALVIDAQFEDQLLHRGEAPGDFVRWGGSVAFDNDDSFDWHWDHTASVPQFKHDFYSVALHELVHTLGFGASDEWLGLVSGNLFTGAASYAANGNAAPGVIGGHWSANTQSTVYGSSTLQEVSLDPSFAEGTRKYLTTLDAAALQDIGWQPQAPELGGDFDQDGDVDGADFLVWQRGVHSAAQLAQWESNFGTSLGIAAAAAVAEPSAVAAALVGIAMLAFGERRRWIGRSHGRPDRMNIIG